MTNYDVIIKCNASNDVIIMMMSSDLYYLTEELLIAATFFQTLFHSRCAIYANRLYLSLFQKTHPERLATNGPQLPNIVGHVRIHPTALVDPTATVSGGRWEGSLRKEGGGVRDVGMMVGDERSSRRGDGKVLDGVW